MWTHLGYVHTFLSMLHKIKGIYFLPKEPKRNISFTQCNTLKHNKDINGYNVKFNL
ncbi:unknown [Prevotella sp. CAG:1185]|nr:unknown [Prevotella sp. CAG:1185]